MPALEGRSCTASRREDDAAFWRGETDDGDEGAPLTQARATDSDAMLLHCLFAMVFAAAALGALNCLGVVASSGGRCEASENYTRCEVWQDCRSLLSFVLGALLCPLFTTRWGRAADEGAEDKSHFYMCLL